MERLNFRVTEPMNDNAARKFASNFDTALLTDQGNAELQAVCKNFIDFFQNKILQVSNFSVIPTEKGSLSNDYALLAARQYTGSNTILASQLAHKSVQQAAEKQSLTLHTIPCMTNCDYNVDNEKLAEFLHEHGHTIGTIVITIGVTAHGKLSDFPINQIQQYVLRERAMGRKIWLHVDAAFGYMEILRRKDQQIRMLLQHADSWTVNPHKWFGPKGLSLVGFKEGKLPKLSDQKYFAGANTIFGSSQSGYAIAAAWHILNRPGSLYTLEKMAKDVYSNAHKLADLFSDHGFRLLCQPETRIVTVDLSHPRAANADTPVDLGKKLKVLFEQIGIDMDICDIDGHYSLRFTMNPAPKKLFYDRLRQMNLILTELFGSNLVREKTKYHKPVPANIPHPDQIAA